MENSPAVTIAPRLLCPYDQRASRSCAHALTALLLLAAQLGAGRAAAATLYVDPSLGAPITDGTYDPATRSGGGSAGNAYTSIKAALLDFKSGDTLVLRGGLGTPSHVYREGHITLWPKQNGTASAWSTIMSYPGEWAILDGENGGGSGGLDGRTVCEARDVQLPAMDPGFTCCTLGYSVYAGPAHFLSYWRFERLEITGGASANGEHAEGFAATGGPFIFRYCYIHDNIAWANPSSNIPGGLRGYTWTDSLVEFCRFERNGAPAGVYAENAAHINIFSDYGWNTIATNGFVDKGPGHHNARNEYRYNLFGEGSIGIKHKGAQLFSGRRPETGHGYDDAFRTYGDRIHHNVFTADLIESVHLMQDFVQIHNNIIDGARLSLGANDEFDYYKTAFYNNTIRGLVRGGLVWFHSVREPATERAFYTMGINNIIDGCGDDSMADDMGIGWSPVFAEASLSDLRHTFDRNYFYQPHKALLDPQGVYVVFLGPGSASSSRLTVDQYEANYPGADLFRNDYSAADALYVGDSGADIYRARGEHVVEFGASAKTVGTAGRGGPHPYLPAVTLPTYIGATNPADDHWVAGVLSLANIDALRAGGEGAPAWVEGGAPASCGDGACGASEDCLNCPSDCGACCGNHVCDAALGDNCSTCPSDCPLGEGQICCFGEAFTGTCCSVADCPQDACSATHFCVNHVCTVMAGACCGDGVCEAAFSEDCESCPTDCAPTSSQVCCRGGLYDGDCCENQDCGGGKLCLEHRCQAPDTCTPGAGQVCCRGGLYDGDCCESKDCCVEGECGVDLLCLDHTCSEVPEAAVTTTEGGMASSSCSGAGVPTSLGLTVLTLIALLRGISSRRRSRSSC